MRKATLQSAENSIKKYVGTLPGVKVPVGIDAVTWLVAKSRPSKDERRLLTAYTVAAQNLRADIRTDQSAALSLWMRLNPSFDEEDVEGEQDVLEPDGYTTRPRG